MSDEVVDEPFKTAAKKVEESYDRAAEELKSKVARSKAAALNKITQ